MFFAIVNNENLSVVDTYESESSRDSDKYFGYLTCSPICSHVQIPEYLDRELIKGKLNDDGEIEVCIDEAKIAAKAEAEKKKRIIVINASMNADIDAQMYLTYDTKDRITAGTIQQSWGDMMIAPEAYVPNIFPTIEALKAYVGSRLLDGREFNIWRIGRVAQRDAEIAALDAPEPTPIP